jgi:hypothetical protein
MSNQDLSLHYEREISGGNRRAGRNKTRSRFRLKLRRDAWSMVDF